MKFTSDTEVVYITFGAEEGVDGPVFFVKDNGAGCGEAYDDSLFNPFQRLHCDTVESIGIGGWPSRSISWRNMGGENLG